VPSWVEDGVALFISSRAEAVREKSSDRLREWQTFAWHRRFRKLTRGNGRARRACE
jgi:hypothetical protein